ncbi:hypothetical protein EIP86_005278 [Pleurotus ostreatoroseus]|nr:hypothetical protein EIP86_005278 [Pleurotus ostreatoroseus]
MAEEHKGKDVSRNTSPSTSSQGEGDMADNEAEAGPSTQPAEESTAPPPPKKKRTRTLTTPHQAAVLHALLAQSRFPTTAMREEVGRAIGLSARKVQIWFQNQRQKARRPRGQNVPPLSRPPQYGPFQNVPSGSSIPEAGPSSRAGAVAEALRAVPDFQSAPSSAASESFSYRGSFSSERPPQLSGPGVPGSIPSSPPSPRAIRSAPYPRPETRGMFGPHSPRASSAMRPLSAEARPRHPPRARAMSPQPRQSIDSAMAALTLPPLTFDRPRSYTVSGPSGSSSFYPLTPSIVPPSSSQSGMETLGQARPRLTSMGTDSPFAHDAPLRIPPPFTLQPRPQWDDASFSPFHRRSTRPVPTRIPHEPFTLPHPSGLSQEGTARPLPPPPLLTPLIPLSSIPPEAAVTSHLPTTPEASGSMPARHRRYDEDDAKSHD